MAAQFLNLGITWQWMIASRLCCFISCETALGTHCILGWLVPRADLDDVVKLKICFSFRETNRDPTIVRLVAWLLH